MSRERAKPLWLLIVPSVVCILLWAGTAGAVQLRLGSARVEITPSVGYPLQGYGARKGVSIGIHDPLFARVLVVKSAQTSVAFVSCDLVEYVSPHVVKGAWERFRIPHVLISSSHTHSGPPTSLDDGSEVHDVWYAAEKSWYDATDEKILQAIGEASRSTEPVSLVVGIGFVDLGYNRRWVDAVGHIKMVWENPQRIPTHPVDPRVAVLVFKDVRKNVRAVVVNYACHASVLGPDNLQISADYPGVMCKYVEEQLGGNAICFFAQGGAGDISAYDAHQPGFDAVQRTGLALSQKVVEIVNRVKTQKGGKGRLQVKHDVLDFPHRWKPTEKVRLGMDSILFDYNLAIVTMPGEPFVGLQLLLEGKSQIEYTLPFGYTYTGDSGSFGYIPTHEAALQGGYGADEATIVGLGAGEAMVEQAVANLHQMANESRGRLTGKLQQIH